MSLYKVRHRALKKARIKLWRMELKQCAADKKQPEDTSLYRTVAESFEILEQAMKRIFSFFMLG